MSNSSGGRIDGGFLYGASAVVATGVFAYSLYALYTEKNGNKTDKPWKLVPGRKFLTGHIHMLKNTGDFVEVMEKWADEYGKETGCYEVQFLRRKFIAICTYEGAMQVLKHRPFTVRRTLNIREAAASIGANGVFAAEEDQWKTEHKLVSATLNKKSVGEYLESFKDMSKRLVQKWKKDLETNEGGIISVENDLGSISADSIAKVTMDRDLDLLHQPDSKTSKDIRMTMSGMITRTRAPIRYWKIPFVGQYLDGLGAAIKSVQEIVNETVIEHENKETDTRLTFVRKMIDTMKSEKSPITRDRLVGNVVTMFMAGTDTTSSALMTALYLLGRDTGLQETLRAEADSVNLDAMDLRDLLTKLPRLKSFLHEAHYWYGVPIIGLRITKDVQFHDTTIPAGHNVFVLLRYISQARGSFKGSSTKEFSPERWLERDESGNLACPTPTFREMDFTPFGYGQRACPGRTYSEALSYSILLSLLQNFEWKLAPGVPTDSKFKSDVVMIPACEVRLSMTRRDT